MLEKEFSSKTVKNNSALLLSQGEFDDPYAGFLGIGNLKIINKITA